MYTKHITQKYAKWSEITDEAQKAKIIKEELESDSMRDIYAECAAEDWESDRDEIINESGLDAELKLDAGSSYVFIKNIKVKNEYKQVGYIEYEITFDFWKHHIDVEVDYRGAETDEEETAAELAIPAIKEEYQKKADALCESLEKHVDKNEQLIVYGTDQYFNEEWVEDFIEANDYEYMIEESEESTEEE